jgi:hypothetical protein
VSNAARTREYVDQIPAITFRSVDGDRDELAPTSNDYKLARGTSTPSQESSAEDSGASTPPHQGSSEDSGEETDRTSSSESDEMNTRGCGHGQRGRAQSSLRPGLNAGSRPNPGPQAISSSRPRTAICYGDCCKFFWCYEEVGRSRSLGLTYTASRPRHWAATIRVPLCQIQLSYDRENVQRFGR